MIDVSMAYLLYGSGEHSTQEDTLVATAASASSAACQVWCRPEISPDTAHARRRVLLAVGAYLSYLVILKTSSKSEPRDGSTKHAVGLRDALADTARPVISPGPVEQAARASK